MPPMPLSTTVFLIELGADRTLKTTKEKTAANVAADASEANVEIKQLSSYINGAKPSGRKWDHAQTFGLEQAVEDDFTT